MKKTALIIVGPTAVGKTALSLSWADYLQTEIISADARQCYRELGVGVAKPEPEELARVPHHFINSHSILEEVNGADFETYALDRASDIFSRKDHLVVCGGAGLYIRAFMQGLDPMPAIPEAIRVEVSELYRTGGLAVLQEALEREDPLFAQTGEMMNPHRMMRALAFVRVTGTSIRKYQRRTMVERPFEMIMVGLDLPRERLYERINARVEKMMEQGLLEEARRLLPFKDRNALRTVGYQELFEYLEGHCSLEAAVAKIRQHTRQYAKRQLTWFRAEPNVIWLDAGQMEDPEVLLKGILKI